MTRAEMIGQFWDDVHQILTGQRARPKGMGKAFTHSPQVASAGIQSYKRDIIQQRRLDAIPDAVYNQGEEQTATIIDDLIQKGLPKVHAEAEANV
jgi:hypothetical protein